MKNVIVISPHPDDEAIGCGGAISNHISEGDHVEVIFLTSGERGGHGRSEAETIKIREQEAFEAASILKIQKIEFWRQPDGGFEANAGNIKRLKNKMETLKANIVYVPHEEEEHRDHKVAALLVRLAISKMDDAIEKAVVWMYEVWTPIQKIDHVVDFTSYMEVKRKAILAHKSQCDVLKFDEAILGLNRYRGEMHSWPGGDYAEIFKEMKI